MSLTTSNFTIEQLESRFEMQCMADGRDQYYMEEQIDDGSCSGGGGGSYGYYGNSWDDLGSGEAYAGTYQEASDGSGAMLDDGTYTDGSSGSFPGYDTRDPTNPDPSCFPTYPCSPPPSKCTICRC